MTVWKTVHVGFNNFGHEAIGWGMFCSRRVVRRSGTRNNFLFVNHLAGVLKRGSDIVGRQFGVCVGDSAHGIAAGHHPENALHHNAAASNGGLSAAEFGIDNDTIIHCKLPCQGDAAKENFELLIVSDTCQAGACQCIMRPFFVKLCNYVTILWGSPGPV